MTEHLQIFSSNNVLISFSTVSVYFGKLCIGIGNALWIYIVFYINDFSRRILDF